MLKYIEEQICIEEVPDEISLGISIIGCPYHCEGCHSDFAWNINCKNIGKDLTIKELDKLIEANSLVSCILFFGGDWNGTYLNTLLEHIKVKYNNKYKIALYSGYGNYFETLNDCNIDLLFLDYLKVGAYNKNVGGLKSKDTNQRMYKIEIHNIFGEPMVRAEDITNKFWKENLVTFN